MSRTPAFDLRLREAQALRSAGRTDALAASLAQAQAAAAGDALAQAALAAFHTQSQDYAAALTHYDEAVRLAPGHTALRYNRAAVSRFLGRLESAEQDLDTVIAATPHDSEAWQLRSDLRVQTPTHNHVEALRAHLARGFSRWQDEVPIRYALAKELEDLGQHAASWAHLHSGAGLRRRHLTYDVGVDVATAQWIQDAFAARLPCSSAPATGPLFILGMPRTGSTLLERLLGAHPQVRAAGELPHLAHSVVAAAQAAAGGTALSRAQLIAASGRADFSALGADYLQRSAGAHGATPRWIDKMPLNYLYCGLIARALPGARILHLTRHPMATGYALYKTLFAQGYPFSYDLQEIAEYYLGYRRLMAHWHATLPGTLLDVSYEALVTEPARVCAAVYAFCGLEWQDAYLHPDPSGPATTTASAAQVRRPIYQSSLAQWRHYAAPLQPLAARLSALL